METNTNPMPTYSTDPMLTRMTPSSIMSLTDGNRYQSTLPFAPLPSIQPPSPGASPQMSYFYYDSVQDSPSLSSCSSTNNSPASKPIKPLISPSLRQLLPEGALRADQAAMRLASKSNYQNILDGDSEVIGLKYKVDIQSGMEVRRTSHKTAEQKRRDLLKQCFEDLKSVTPNLNEKNISKEYILKKCIGHTHILSLRNRIRNKDDYITALKSQLARRGITPMEYPESERSIVSFELEDPALV
ncbi:hypothetical protein K7432_016098 [Basidiobolus ranarum]|uniref:BHLH domain-containing protein n=1 Tax=Basidiobolus ranarum TaxID=34480 RepID=A0ABR2WF91_9FUNG